MTSTSWPTEIRLTKDRRHLVVSFDDGKVFDLPAELLRVYSPSAEVQGHSAAGRRTVGGKRNVMILRVDAVGNYAIRLGFDDLHDTGIFTWPFLRDMGETLSEKLGSYEKDLAAKGLTRDKPGIR